MLHKTVVTMDGGELELDAYSNNSYWNGWADVYFTKESLELWIGSSPYDLRFEGNTALIYFEELQVIDAELMETVDGPKLLFDMNGYTFDYKDDYEDS